MNQSGEKSPEASGWTVPEGYYFNYNPRSGDKSLTIPAHIVKAVGGKDYIFRMIFPDSFGGYPCSAQNFEEEGYWIELPIDTDEKTFDGFIHDLEAIAKMNMETEMLRSALGAGNQIEAVERRIGSRVKPVLHSIWSRLKGSE